MYKILILLIVFAGIGCKKDKQAPDDTALARKKTKKTKGKAKKQNSKPKNKNQKKVVNKADKKANKKPKKAQVEKDLLKFPGKVISKPFPHKTISKDGKTLYQLDSFQFKQAKIKGYKAPIQLKVVFDVKGKILQIEFGKHKETKSFIKRIKKEWLPKLIGLKPEAKIVGKGGVDALTECTMSTSAIKKSVDYLRKQMLKLNK